MGEREQGDERVPGAQLQGRNVTGGTTSRGLFVFFFCKSLLFFFPRTTFTPRPCTQKKGEDEDAPEGVYQNQRMLQPLKPQCTHLDTTHPPPPPPNLPPLHFWGKKSAFLAPSTPSMVGSSRWGRQRPGCSGATFP